MKPPKPRILTIKFALLEASGALQRILQDGIERIGLSDASLQMKALNPADNVSRSVIAPDHTVAVGALMDSIEERHTHCEAQGV